MFEQDVPFLLQRPLEEGKKNRDAPIPVSNISTDTGVEYSTRTREIRANTITLIPAVYVHCQSKVWREKNIREIL